MFGGSWAKILLDAHAVDPFGFLLLENSSSQACLPAHSCIFEANFGQNCQISDSVNKESRTDSKPLMIHDWTEPLSHLLCFFQTCLRTPCCKLYSSMALQGHLKSGYLWSSLEQLDVETAEASVAADKEQILQIVTNGVPCPTLVQDLRCMAAFA